MNNIYQELQKRLDNVVWKEYKIWDLFEVKTSKKIFHANTVYIYTKQIEWTLPYVVRSTKNNWIRWYIKENKTFSNPWNTLSFAQDTFTVFYQEQNYFTWNNIKILQPKFNNTNKFIMLFISICLNKSLNWLSWWVWSTINTIKNMYFFLPTKNWQPDFDFMINFISAIKKNKIKKIQDYIILKWIKNTILTSKEKEVLDKLKTWQIKWKEYKIWDLFFKIKTNKIKKTKKWDLPATTATLSNNQIGCYVSRENATILKGVFSATANGFWKVFYQPNEFTICQDSYAFDFKNYKITNEDIYLFILTCLNKVFKKYNWAKKSTWNRIKNENILLPVKNWQPDFDFMINFISAIKKNKIKKYKIM